jgi:UDP-2-acetamido-3-amino-2,3-dideoxy-glucuronate N-acetyltransferase
LADYFVHPTSVVEEGAQIGPNTRIWHFCHVSAPCSIGPDCNIGQNVFIAKNTQIGRNVKIQNNVSVYEGVVLEDDVFCGPSVVFTNVFNPRAFISRMEERRTTLVKKGASLGANATIVCGVTIGPFAFIGAGAVVTRDVPGFALVYGNPARRKGWVCRGGERLNLEGESGRCRRCGEEYELHSGTLRPRLER